MSNELVKALTEFSDRRDKRKKSETRGVVVTVTATLAMVKIGGSGRAQPCQIPSGLSIKSGDICKLIANTTSSSIRWVISEVIDKPVFGGGSGTGQDYSELYPPANVRVDDVIAGAVTVVWDSPVDLRVVFEVETGDGADSGVKILQTSGSYAIIATTTPINVRVRSVAPNGQTSAYSPWVTGNPAIQTRSSNSLRIPFAYNTPSPIALITALNGSFVSRTIVEVTTAFNGASPTLKIGEAGTTDRLMATTECDLKIIGQYETSPLYEYPGDTDVIATLVPSGSTQGAGVITLVF
jgi:hypothetical protein